MLSPVPRPFLNRTCCRLSLFLLLTAMVCGLGCSSNKDKDSVSGKVTLNGKPVTGIVAFIYPDNKEVTGPIQAEGKYTISNPPAGEVKVVVKGGIIGGKVVAPTGATGAPSGPVVESPPAKYASPNNGLTFTVKGGHQTYDIPLTP